VLDRIERTSQEMEELAGAPLPEERVTTLDDKLTAAQAGGSPLLRTFRAHPQTKPGSSALCVAARLRHYPGGGDDR
jgi:hypothetical protein